MSKQVLDFIVIGAQKSGTTSLFEYLSRHPELCLPASKEMPYFNHGDAYRGDWDLYLRKALPNADPSRRWGTVTPQYMYGGGWEGAPESATSQADVRTIPRRIYDQLPDVKLVAILRDPTERARSHHAMALLDGWDTRTFDEAVRELLTPEALVRSRREIHEITGYVVFGEYGRILAGYLDVFPPEQLLVLFLSELKSDPQSTLQRVFEFLEIDSDYVPPNLGVQYHASGVSNRIKWLDLYRLQVASASNPLLRGAWHALPERTRRRVDHRFNRMNYRTRLWNRRGWSRRETETSQRDPETDRLLREHFEADAQLLAELIGVVPPWSAAHRASASSSA